MAIESMSLVCQKPVYYAGEVISGFCNVVVTRPVQMSVIQMSFSGSAHVEWTESRSESYTDSNGQSQTRTVTDSYSSNQEIICLHRDLVIQGGYFQPGTYSLPFSIDTTPMLVSSFEGFHGSVRYYVKAKKPRIGGEWCLFQHKVRTYVCILQPIDTNIPMYMFPVAGTDSKTICCCCCASGPLTIEARTDRAAYCPGEFALVTARFANQSSRQVRPYARLVQHQRYYAQGSRNYALKNYPLVPTNDRGETTHLLSEGGSTEWNQIAFQIPPCYPSMKCEIIDVSYCIEICMDIPMAFDLKVSLPIVVATIPFRGSQVVTEQPASSYPTGWAGIGYQTGPKIESLAPPPISVASDRMAVEAPPPSYFETVFTNDASLAKQAEEKKPPKKKPT